MYLCKLKLQKTIYNIVIQTNNTNHLVQVQTNKKSYSYMAENKRSVTLIKEEEFQLKDYQSFLDKLAHQNPVSSDIISNKNPAHASILMATLLANTEHSMRMYCTGLRPALLCGKKEGDGQGFEGAYWEEFKNFFNKTIKNKDFKSNSIKILIQQNNWIENAPFRIVSEALKNKDTKNKMQVKLITPAWKEKIEETLGKQNGYNYNFAIFDEKAFRLEFDAENYQALASFNNKTWSDILLGLFEKAFENANDITEEICGQEGVEHK